MMPKVRIGWRGWGWLWWIVAVELVLLGAQAVPTFLPAPAAVTDGVTAGVTAARQANSARDTPERASLQPVLDFQPFGVAAPPATPPEPAAAAPAPPSGGLVLQGVLLRGDGAASRALLSSDGGPARIYATGDVLPGGGTLSGIEVDRIWIDLDRQKRILRFPDPGTIPGATQPAPDQTLDETGDKADTQAKVSAAQTKAQSPKQPDLRHLIPGLVADTLSKP